MSPKNEIDANVKQELDDEGYDSCDSSRDSNSPSQDDGAAHFTFQQLPYESIAGDYNILVYRHEGTSANILDCYCLPKRIICVVKVFHGTQMFSTKALNEINTLELLAKHDNAGKHFVKMLDSFKYGNRTHIALDRLGWSLQWYLVRRCYRRRFTVYAICKLGRQMLESVALMHDLHLIHTDLKPEHLLFPSDNFNLSRIYKAGTGSRKELDFLLPIPSPFSLKLIDFTSTIYEQDKQYHSNIVSTRQYRAPEVILGLGWSYPCDVWSVGCILAELYVGKILFDRTDDDDLQHLALMERMLGKFPSHMLEKTLHPVGKYFKNGRLNLPKNLTRAVMGLRPVRELFPSDVSGFKADFLNLLQGLLQLDPSERLTARDALGHPFFTKKEDA